MNNIAKHSKANLVRLSLGRQDNRIGTRYPRQRSGFQLGKGRFAGEHEAGTGTYEHEGAR